MISDERIKEIMIECSREPNYPFGEYVSTLQELLERRALCREAVNMMGMADAEDWLKRHAALAETPSRLGQEGDK